MDFYNILVHGSAGDILLLPDGTTKPNTRRKKPEILLSPEALALASPGIDHSALQTLFTNHLSVYLGDPLDALMNGPIRKKLGIIPPSVTWGSQSDAVFSTLSLDFQKPTYADVDVALNSGRIKVVVEEGQVDLICSNQGADLWMKRLTWANMSNFYAAQREPRYPSAQAQSLGATSAFIKQYGNLIKYDVLNAGHSECGGDGRLQGLLLSLVLFPSSSFAHIHHTHFSHPLFLPLPPSFFSGAFR